MGTKLLRIQIHLIWKLSAEDHQIVSVVDDDGRSNELTISAFTRMLSFSLAGSLSPCRSLALSRRVFLCWCLGRSLLMFVLLVLVHSAMTEDIMTFGRTFSTAHSGARVNILIFDIPSHPDGSVVRE